MITWSGRGASLSIHQNPRRVAARVLAHSTFLRPDYYYGAVVPRFIFSNDGVYCTNIATAVSSRTNVSSHTTINSGSYCYDYVVT